MCVCVCVLYMFVCLHLVFSFDPLAILLKRSEVTWEEKGYAVKGFCAFERKEKDFNCKYLSRRYFFFFWEKLKIRNPFG